MYQVLKNHLRCFTVSGRTQDHQYNTTHFPINCFVQAPSTAHYGELKSIEQPLKQSGYKLTLSADLQQQRRQGGVREGRVKPDERVLQEFASLPDFKAGICISGRLCWGAMDLSFWHIRRSYKTNCTSWIGVRKLLSLFFWTTNKMKSLTYNSHLGSLWFKGSS